MVKYMAKKKKRKHTFLKIMLALIIVGVITYAYGAYVEPKQLAVEEHTVQNKNLTDDLDGFKIIHISDLHYGKYYQFKDLQKMVKRINELNADIVVLTGDLLDKDTKMTTSMADKISTEMQKISANSGKYAINGEDDLNFDEWENIIASSGFMNLNNNYDTIYKNGYDSILLAGVSTMADKESIINKNQKAENFLNSFEKDGPIYSILLIHEPDYIDELDSNKYNLVLAGHSHYGQVNLPIINTLLYPKGATKYHYNHYKLKHSELYISNGLGNTDFNFRLFNTPTINVYRLIK